MLPPTPFLVRVLLACNQLETSPHKEEKHILSHKLLKKPQVFQKASPTPHPRAAKFLAWLEARGHFGAV